MKKTILCMLLMLLVGLLALPASAATESHPHNGDHCVCGGAAVGVGDHTECTDLQWTPLSEALQAVGLTMSTANFGKLPSGNYYLDGDVVVTGSNSIGTKADSLATEPDTVVELSICLNGYNITRSTGRVFGSVQMDSVLNICDCSYDGSTFGSTVSGGKNQYGSIIYTNCRSTLNIYGGNFTGKGYTNGGAIVVGCDNCGDVDGNGKYEEKDRQNADASVMNLYNGHISGSTVTASGGTIQLFHPANMNMYGGTIVGGTAGGSGGAISGGKGTIKIAGGTIIGGAADTNGGAIYSSGTVYITGGNIIGGTCKSGTEVVQVIQNDGKLLGTYVSFAEGLAKAQNASNCYMRLINDLEASDTISGTLYLDLNGHTLKGIHITGTLYGMDCTTNLYDGSAAGSLIPASGKPQMQVKTTQAQVGAARRYLAIEENGSYSFHRYYMAITKLTLKPGTAGMGYKATFVGSDYIKQQLSGTIAYGYSMWLTEDVKIQRGYPASRFGGEQELTLRIDNFLATGLNAAKNEERANQKVYASVYLRLADGTLVETDPVSYTFREMLELANTQYSGYSTTQQSALQTLSSKFSASMISWDINNIHHATGSVWRSVTSSAFNTILKNNSNKLPSGSYVLNQDVDIDTKTIRIESGRTVNICLNGYTLSGSARLFRNFGNLNLCDCHSNDAEGTYQSSYTIDTDNTDSGEYAPIMYCYATSVTNLYGGNMKATNPITFAGLIAISHDNEDKTLPPAVFNMYGGTIHGNTVNGEGGDNKTASGGAVSVWNGATFNLYGGNITGGTATRGGIFNIASNCTMNIYGGVISGGTAIKGTLTDGSILSGLGGNIYNSGILNIYGGIISGGSALEGKGGNVYSSGEVNMYGGTVTGGTATVLLDENGEETYNTGVGGGIYMYSSSIHISGNAVIDGNENYNLYLSSLSDTNIRALTGNAKIGIASDMNGTVSDDVSTISRLSSDHDGCSLYTANGKVMLGTSQPVSFDQSVSEFSVGYAITNIMPTEIGLQMSPWGNPSGRKTDGSVETRAEDNFDIYATTVAITDQENNTVLMITLDLQSVGDTYADFFSRSISAATGIPADQIYISATHTHNCPSLTTNTPGNTRYVNQVTEALISGALQALADRAPATMETGSFDTVGMNWTRNYYYYLNNDTSTEPIYYGDQYGQKPQNGETIFRVRDGDTTMHMLAFNRDNKQPVLVVNWRAHPHRSGGMFKYTVNADVIGAVREYMHDNTDYLFAYFQGAAGNMNTTSRISGETYKSGYIKKYGDELGRQIVEMGFPKLKSTETGLIQTTSIVYAGAINHDDEIYYENAQALYDYFKANPELMDSYDEQIEKAKEYEGVYTVYHAQQIIARHNAGETRNISMNVFSIGDKVGFCTAPGEIWDRVSEELEELSPFETTFFIGYCDGGVGYIPYGVAGNYPSYEYYSCVFKQDEVITEMMNYYQEQLQEQYDNAQ